jgi:hypothetical protein
MIWIFKGFAWKVAFWAAFLGNLKHFLGNSQFFDNIKILFQHLFVAVDSAKRFGR